MLLTIRIRNVALLVRLMKRVAKAKLCSILSSTRGFYVSRATGELFSAHLSQHPTSLHPLRKDNVEVELRRQRQRQQSKDNEGTEDAAQVSQ